MDSILNHKISPIFIGLIILCVAAAVYLNGATDNLAIRVGTSVLVLAIWVIGLCLHEFSHALTSHMFGDTSIENKGYLSLNPLLYSDIQSSIIFPIFILAIGGLPLPGGAVYLRHDLIRTRWKISITYLAGPLANVLLAFILASLLGIIGGSINDPLHAALVAAIFLQIYGAIFNLLPIPGFDGFGTIAAFLPASIKATFEKIGALSFVFILLAIFAFPSAFQPIIGFAIDCTALTGIDISKIPEGMGNFMF